VMPGQSSGTLPAAGSGVRVIAEPGRYMVSDSHTLATTVMGRRTVKDEGEDARMYYVNDSLYGSFNCLIFDHGVIDAVHVPHATVAAGFEANAAALVFSPATKLRYDDGHAKPAESEPGFVPQGGLPEIPFEGPVMRSSLWGQTCDGMDCLMRKAVMPKMEIGDHLVCHTMGAYTTAAGSNFNGFESPDRVYLENGEVIDTR
jgi:ornithine decarboxylase